MIRIVRRLSRASAFMTIMTSLRIRETDETSAEDIASLKATLGNSLQEDGSIDYDRLREKTTPVDFGSPQNETGREYTSLAPSHQP